MSKILVIAAHPDDEIYGMGGTISRLTSEGNEVFLLIVTDGSSSQYRESKNLDKIIENKCAETKKAAQIVGIKKIFYGNLPDMRLDQTDHIKINEIIENVIDEIRPDTVFTHFYGDVNLDHRCVYQSTVVATRPTASQCVSRLFCYSVPSSTEWQPETSDTVFMANYIVDIGEYCKIKEDAILAYQTELRNYPHPRSVEAIRIFDKNNGVTCGLNACEKFILMRGLLKNESSF